MKIILKTLILTCSLLASNLYAEVTTSVEQLGIQKQAQDLDSSLPQCKELIKNCYVSSADERTKCFFSTAKHPFCDGSPLGSLIFKRWAMAPHKIKGIQAPPALLGPRLVDKKCISTFENKLSAVLQHEQIVKSSMAELDKFLDTCSREISDRLSRP